MRILVVDDSMTNLAVASKYLKDINEITEITLCGESEKAIAIIDQKNIDILLLDVVMPVVTGFDILEILRSNHQYDDIPIIMFTSLSDDKSFQKCFDLGASDYINKPIHVVEFRARIKAAIDARSKSMRLNEMLEEICDHNTKLQEINNNLVQTKSFLVQSEKMAAIGQLAAGIAHEINNPIGFVSGNNRTLYKYFARITDYLEAVDKTLTGFSSSCDEETRNAVSSLAELYSKLKMPIIMQEIDGILDDSYDGIQRVNKIVQSLRTFARPVNDEEQENWDLLNFINQVVLISRNEVRYVADIFIFVDENMSVYGNEVQLGQVLINILVNAAQAIKSQHRSTMGRIDIRAFGGAESVRIEIEDDGPGIAEEHLSKIFDPFFTTKDVGVGTGLGLSIAYDIICNKHKGIIEAESTAGKGAKFIITLPAQEAITDKKELSTMVNQEKTSLTDRS